ncbi:MAG TPA: AAA family ATPase, partial [Planctomycetota bacterium]|nr:AAA family ATPase [Planctomycetota bacterium]
MHLCHLDVKHFGCIDALELDLCPGLNVLFGPNDLGKSSLGAAIRCALLLPHGSAAHEDYVSWTSAEAPEVALSFCMGERRFYRVTKRFHASRGVSVLEAGPDGTSFAEEHRGRKVDEEIRKLLAWGLGGVGGKGGQRGIPRSFLATALLAEQGEVDELLRCGLAGDLDDTGRRQVSQALQALGQSEEFKLVLERTQAKVDEAFTATGRLRQGKNDPLTRARDRVN